ncbi:hypothetical protein D3C80_592330 [compost metagenome]
MLDHAPFVVQQIADVLDIHIGLETGAVREEGRQFLSDAQVELGDVRRLRAVPRRGPARILHQARALQVVVEACEVEAGAVGDQRVAGGRDQTRGIRGRHVQQHAVTRRVDVRFAVDPGTGDGVAIGQARATLAEQGEAGAIVAEEGPTIAEAQLGRVLDLVVRSRDVRVVRIEHGDLAVVRGGHRRGARVDVVGVDVGVGQVEAQAFGPALIPVLVHADGGLVRVAALEVGQHQHDLAGVRARVDRAAVRADARLTLGHVQVDPADGVFDFRVDVFGADVPALAQVPARQVEVLVAAQRELPDRRNLEGGVNDVDDARALLGRGRHALLRDRVRREAVRDLQGGQFLGRADRDAAADVGAGVAGGAALELADQVARVRIVVRHPHVRRTAHEQAEAAIDVEAVVDAIVEAEARLQQGDAVQVVGVLEAVAGFERRVLQRLVVHFVPFETEAGAQGQAVGQVELVLSEQDVRRVTKRSAAIDLIVGSGVLVVDVGRVAVAEVVDRGELIFGVRGLHEDVVDLEVFALVAEGQAVTAVLILTDEAVLIQIVGQGVGVTRTLRAEDDRRPHRALVRQEDAHGGEVRTREVRGDVLGFLARERELRRELVGPVREQLRLVGRHVRLEVITLRQQADRLVVARGVGAAQVQGRTFGLLIGDDGAVSVVDVPVQLQEILFVEGGQFVGFPIQRIVAVDRLADAADQVDVGLGDRRHLIGGARTRRAAQDRTDGFELLVVGHEEQAVLDDRTGQGRAPGLFFELAGDRTIDALAGGHVLVGEAVALQAVAGLLVEGFPVELVAARLGDRVDHAALERAVLDVVGGHVDLNRFQDRDRDRRVDGRIAVAGQAEVVALADAVDHEGVRTAVLAAQDQGVVVGRIDRGERRGADEVLDVAADRRKGFDLFRIHAGARAGLQAAAAHAADDDVRHGVGVVRRARDGQVQHPRGADADRRNLALDAARGAGGVDDVGTADAQVAREIAAVRAGHDRAAGARGDVGDDDRGVGHRRAGRVRDHAADAARSLLSEGGAGRRQQDGRGGNPIGEVAVQHCCRDPLAAPRARTAVGASSH